MCSKSPRGRAVHRRDIRCHRGRDALQRPCVNFLFSSRVFLSWDRETYLKSERLPFLSQWVSSWNAEHFWMILLCHFHKQSGFKIPNCSSHSRLLLINNNQENTLRVSWTSLQWNTSIFHNSDRKKKVSFLINAALSQLKRIWLGSFRAYTGIGYVPFQQIHSLYFWNTSFLSACASFRWSHFIILGCVL